MGIKDIGIGKKEFNEYTRPWVIPWYLRVVAWVICVYYSILFKCKARNKGIKNLKAPYLLLQNHASFSDFILAWKGIKRIPSNWVTSIEEFNEREWMMRSLGCIPKRKFTADISVVKNIFYAIKTKKNTVVIYPEARFSFAGINENIDAISYARLIKKLGVPVVLSISKGNFVSSPQWAKHPYKKIEVSSDFEIILTAEDVAQKSVEEIKDLLEEKFVYDDYKYWQDSGKKIKCKKRAENIHRILYKCPHCKEEKMTSYLDTIECLECGKKWKLNEHGFLEAEDGNTEFNHVPDWYRWEREEVKKEVESGEYLFEDEVRIEQLFESKTGFKTVGYGKLTQDKNGFTLTGKLDNGEELVLNRPIDTMYSCHVEFDYKGRGDAIDLVTPDCKTTYFVFPQTKRNPLTKLNFSTEELYNYYCKN